MARRSSFLHVAVLGALLCCAGPASAQEPASGESETVTIGLPPGAASDVVLSLGEGSLVLELPAGATYPKEPGASGILRGVESTPAANGRVRLEMRLAGGLFSGVRYGPTSVSVTFRRRVAPGASAEAAIGQYVIGSEDKLRIAVNGQDEFTQEYVVGRSGTVSAPLVGEVTAAGLTVDAFTARLTELLARDYLVSPKVDVQVVEYRSQWAMVAGEVKKAGRVFLRGKTTLKEVLAEAEGLTSEAGEAITISRQSAQAGEAPAVTLDRSEFERGSTNPAIRHGDIVTVEPASHCFVNGEVRNPGDVKITRGLTLLRAISMAGGLTEWANRKEIHVSYKDSDAPPRVYNLKELESKPELDPPLKGGELIMVKRRFL